MAADRRVSVHPSEPLPDDPEGVRRWTDYLEWVREDLIAGVLAVSSLGQRRSQLPSGWTPVELLSHVLHMEQRWLVWGFLGEPVERPWGDWNVDDPSAVGGSGGSDGGGGSGGPLAKGAEGVAAGLAAGLAQPARWQVAESVTVEELVDRLRAVGARTREILLSHGGADRARVGGRFTANPPTLEWICFHVLTEYARHAGQLDIVVELHASTRPPVTPARRGRGG